MKTSSKWGIREKEGDEQPRHENEKVIDKQYKQNNT